MLTNISQGRRSKFVPDGDRARSVRTPSCSESSSLTFKTLLRLRSDHRHCSRALGVLDDELRVVAASRSFYLTFKVNRNETQGKLLFELGDGAWDIPKLRLLLGNIIPERGEMKDYEVDHDFANEAR
jgi:hypothetical protein